MASRRRSGRLQLNEALEESKKEAEALEQARKASSETTVTATTAKKQSVASRKRPRTEDNQHNGKGRDRQASEKDEAVESDGLGDPDFGSEDDDDDSASDHEQKEDPQARKEEQRSRLRKLASNAKRKKKNRRPVEDDDSDDASKDSTSPLPRKKQASLDEPAKSSTPEIPKKKLVDIPRRKPDASSQSTNMASPPSLLANIAKPPPQPPVLPPRFNSSGSGGSGSQQQQRRKYANTPPRKPNFVPPPNRNRNPSAEVSREAPKQYQQPASPPLTTTGAPVMNTGAALEKQRKAMDKLGNLCNAVKLNRDMSLPPASTIDLSGSFIRNDDNKHDFFDLNARNEIVLQPKIPIFPEDFPPGMQEHSLAWWGILDPALGDGKFRPKAANVVDPRSEAAAARRAQQNGNIPQSHDVPFAHPSAGAGHPRGWDGRDGDGYYGRPYSNGPSARERAPPGPANWRQPEQRGGYRPHWNGRPPHQEEMRQYPPHHRPSGRSPPRHNYGRR